MKRTTTTPPATLRDIIRAIETQRNVSLAK